MNHYIDAERIGALFQEHYGLMVVVARRYAPSPDLVYDIIQQTFVDFLEDALKGKRDLEKNVAPLLFQITKNQAIRHWKTEARAPSRIVRAVIERLTGMSDVEPETGQLERWDDELRRLRQCMDRLPHESRILIEQYYYRDMSANEMARRHERKPGAIRQALFTIRRKLRQCIEKK